MKKKIICLICILLFAALSLAPLSACSKKDDGKIKVVCTIFPVYDWAMNVIGDKKDDFSVTLLQDSGADLHSYQPTVADLAAIAEADVFVYVGGESDEWVEDALRSVKNKNMAALDLISILGDKALVEEIVEGMQHDHDHDHDHEDEDEDHDRDHEDEDHDHEDEDQDHDHDHEEEEGELDEHVWLSLKNAEIFTQAIANAIMKADEENKETYSANAKNYIASLHALDQSYAAAIQASPRDTLLFGDRFPFRYLVEDYGLKYYAAFVGCSAESNASFETIRFLASKADELSLKVILKIENSKNEIAEGIKNASTAKNQSIMVLDSLQSANKKEYASGRNYLSVMESNLEVLKTALAA
ncbi:MAG: metal ABC transporter substrate-binding protein [Clostridia bacterium]|nr:metal ABC transporter substrate-binding protein [Clostridia bacterium]